MKDKWERELTQRKQVERRDILRNELLLIIMDV